MVSRLSTAGYEFRLICRPHCSKTKGEYFKGNKLDYPNAATTKHSKKFVKAMKPLSVSLVFITHQAEKLTPSPAQ